MAKLIKEIEVKVEGLALSKTMKVKIKQENGNFFAVTQYILKGENMATPDTRFMWSPNIKDIPRMVENYVKDNHPLADYELNTLY